MAPLETRVGEVNEPVGIRTPLGWVVRGVLGPGQQRNARVNSVFSFIQDTCSLDEELRRFCETESFGTEYVTDCMSSEDRLAVAILDKGIRKLEIGYEAPITWKEGEPSLPDNRRLAEHRLKGLKKRFDRDPEFAKDYRAAVQKYFDQNYAVKLTEEEVIVGQRYYLPHHGVYKTTPTKKKLRVVFDSAAKFKERCLNDAMLCGPNLQTNLASVLLRFREGEVAYAADIEAMFSRIRLRPEDARYHSFLWQEEGSDKVITCQMNRLTFGDCCSPYIALSTTRRAAKDAKQYQELVEDIVEKNVYMDDVLDSARTVSEAIERAKAVRNALADGDFHLQSWVSNCREFLEAFSVLPNQSERVNSNAISLGTEETKALGVYWRPSTDQLTFNVTNLCETVFTRIGIVSKVAAVYDPLGLATPLIVKAKIKIRELSIRGLDWSDEVTGDDQIWWESWFEALSNLNSFTIPRCIFPSEVYITRTELHTFVDASEEAYAAVVYVRHQQKDGHITTRLVMAKSKLAPKKTISVAKLELNAALLGARLAAFVLQSLSRRILFKFYWTDSSCVRNWVRATAAFYKPFVSHRIGEIQTLTEANEWRFIPGKLNVSDAATRSHVDLANPIPSTWLNGPDFLFQTQDRWPKDLPWMVVVEESRAGRVHTALKEEPDWEAVLIEPKDIPLLIRLNGNWAYLLRRCQEEAFEDELIRLQKGKSISKRSKLQPFTQILDRDGFLRLGGRIGQANLPYDNLHPLLLPANHPLSRAIVRAFHQSLHHRGTDHILAHIRQHFWILNGRELVKKVRRACEKCREETSRPAMQLMGELPKERLEFGTPPFTRTAVDYFGPVEVGFARNRTAKRYGALFTCLVTRAVYLDLARSLSTDDFLLVFRRFISLHGKPESIHSDNGTNFVGAERELSRAIQELEKSEELKTQCDQRAIVWKFQPPNAPNFGGAHESLVKSTKQALRRALETELKQGRLPTDDILQTLLFEVAGLLNSRPLAFASSDVDDYRPLTPNDFLNKPPVADIAVGNFTSAHPREHFKYLQRALNLFWDLWKSQVLQSLSQRRKWTEVKRNLMVGDGVLIIDQNLKRGQWMPGRIIEIFPGQDGLVRVAKVRTERGEFVRPVHRLCLFEAVESSPSDPASGENGSAKSGC